MATRFIVRWLKRGILDKPFSPIEAKARATTNDSTFSPFSNEVHCAGF